MKQATALAILKQGHHVFLTGQAGAGKTYLLNQYIRYLHEHGVAVAITASTGIASTHMNGTTIHAWAGIGIKDSFDTQDFVRLYKRETTIDRLKSVKVLIIDEVSMLHARQLDLVDEVLRKVRENELPFGGVQVILSGDFFQLPPIGQKGESNKDKFAFMAKVWVTLATTLVDNAPLMKVCYLSEQFRQTENDDAPMSLNRILNEIREQDVSPLAVETLLATKAHTIQGARTRLYTHNVNVDKINQEELATLTTPAHEFSALTLGDKELITTLQKNARTPALLALKVGAKVMFTKNNGVLDVYNGTMGAVVDFVTVEGTLAPKVQLNDGRQIIVEAETWSIDDEDGVPLASFSQLPLCLAWAITIHKSQGMTLDAAEIDLSNTFELGQGYVALSRVRTLSGLKLLGINHKSLLLDNFAQVANRRFLVLSAECEAWFEGLSDKERLEAEQAFLNKHANATLAQVKKPPNKPKHSTYDETLTLLKEGKTIAEIASLRKLAQSTIIGHIAKLVEDERLDVSALSALRPDEHILMAVDNAIRKLITTGELTDRVVLNVIYDELRQTVSYSDIRLAVVFLDTEKLFGETSND